MRPTTALVAALLLLGCNRQQSQPGMDEVYAIVENEGPLPAGLEQKAIPQDRERIKRARAEKVAWYRTTTVEPYRAVGNRNPKWDEAAIDALEKLCISKAVGDQDMEALERAAIALERAVELGCDDPLVRYFQVKHPPIPPAPADAARVEETSQALMNSKYPAIRRANAMYNYALTQSAKPGTRAAGDVAFKACFKLFHEALQGGSKHATNEFVDVGRLYIEFRIKSGQRDGSYDDVVRELKGFDGVRARLKGHYTLIAAWSVRGANFGQQVPDANMRRFESMLQDSEDAFAKAWKLDPSESDVAVGMISIHGTQGDYAGMNAWFERAMNADGDCLAACSAKLNFLQPQWGGHTEAMRQFCDRMAETANWESGLPAEGLKNYEMIALYHRSQGVLAKHWPTVTSHVRAWAKDRPESRWPWTLYAYLGDQSSRSDTFAEANEHLNGDPLRTVVAKTLYDSYETNAKHRARK